MTYINGTKKYYVDYRTDEPYKVELSYSLQFYHGKPYNGKVKYILYYNGIYDSVQLYRRVCYKNGIVVEDSTHNVGKGAILVDYIPYLISKYKFVPYVNYYKM